MSYAIFIGLVVIFSGIYCGENYSKLSETGILARIDLINSLKIALNLSEPKPMVKERNAAFEFVKFLNTSRSDEYLEAFYANSKVDNTNKFQQFLNGILFNGNPSLPIWNAAEILTKMMKTKTDPDKLEKMRGLAKTISMSEISKRTMLFGNPAKVVEIESPNSSISSIKEIDFVDVYKKPELVLLRTLLASVLKKLYGVQLR